MMTSPATIYVVDDDPAVRRSLGRMLRAAGYPSQAFGSAIEFLTSAPVGPGCLVLDVCLPDLDGFAVQQKLAGSNYYCMPIIFITGHGDIPMTVKAMKAGAVDFLAKPFRAAILLDSIRQALAKDALNRCEADEMQDLSERVRSLSPREYAVFKLVITGMLNKQIAAELQITERTVKAHRHAVMAKLGTVSTAQMVHIADRLGIGS